MERYNYIKNKDVYIQKITIKKIKTLIENLEKIFAAYITDEKFLLLISKGALKSLRKRYIH